MTSEFASAESRFQLSENDNERNMQPKRGLTLRPLMCENFFRFVNLNSHFRLPDKLLLSRYMGLFLSCHLLTNPFESTLFNESTRIAEGIMCEKIKTIPGPWSHYMRTWIQQRKPRTFGGFQSPILYALLEQAPGRQQLVFNLKPAPCSSGKKLLALDFNSIGFSDD